MRSIEKSRDIRGLAGWLALAFVAAAIGGLGSAEAPAFYGQLELPPWAPPAWLFGPVWSALYLMMGTASWLVWRRAGFSRGGPALTLYAVQLLVNVLWSWLFFAWRAGALAFIEILVLWVLLAATLASFWRLVPLAGILLIPYLAWVSFAAALAYQCWRLNPTLLG